MGNKIKIFLDYMRSVIVSAALIGFGAWGTYDLGPDTYRLFFTKPVVCSVPELFNVWKTVEAEVTGIIDTGNILEEQTKNKRDGASMWQKYYYAFMDNDWTTGFYAYSELAPEEFLTQYGKGQVTLRGIWEETPRAIMIQEPMSRMGEQMTYLNENMKSRDANSLFKALDDYRKTRAPVSAYRRLNLQPTRFKLEKAVTLLFLVSMLGVGVALLWSLVRRKDNDKEATK